jgi:hypothetical protein
MKVDNHPCARRWPSRHGGGDTNTVCVVELRLWHDSQTAQFLLTLDPGRARPQTAALSSCGGFARVGEAWFWSWGAHGNNARGVGSPHDIDVELQEQHGDE